MSSDRPHHPPQPPERGSSSSWRRDTATTTSSSSPMSPARADSSLISFPQLSFLGGLPTSYSHDARKVSPLTSTALASSNASNPYGLPASMNPGLPASISASTTSTSGDSSASPTSPSWSTWQSILRERDNAARILRGSSLYQGPQASKEMHQSSSSSTSSHNNPLPLTGRSYRPPSTATMSSDSAAGHGSSSAGTGTGTGTGTWGRSQKSSQTSLRSYPSPSMMLQKLQQEGGGGGGGSSFTHGSAGGGGRTSTTVDTASSAPATPNVDESNDEREGEGKSRDAGAVIAAGPRTSAGPEGVPVSPGSEDWSNLLDSPPVPPPSANSQWQQPGEREPSTQQVQLHLHPTEGGHAANLSAGAKMDDATKGRGLERPPLSPIPGSLSGSDSFPIPTPKGSGLAPAAAASSAILFPQQAAPAAATLRRSSTAPPHDDDNASSYSTTSPASEERHRTAFAQEARAKYKELQALHLAELEGYDRLFESEGVLSAKNGCEQVFMPKPHLSVQRYDESEEGKRKRSTSSGGGGCLGGGDEGKGRSPIRAVSFERNRRPTAKSLSALASASTPNLRATSTMHDTTTSSTRGSRRFTAGQHHRPPPPLPHSAGPILSFSSTSKRLPPLPSSPLPPLGGRARSNSEPRSPTRLLSVEAPASSSSNAPGPTTPALDASSSGSSSESSSLRSSLDLETVLRQGRELEAERQEWRRQFAKSIEGPAFGYSSAKVPTGKPTPRPRELMSRYELFQAGPLSPSNERTRPRLSRTFSRRVSADKGGLCEPIEGSPRRKSFAEALEEGAARHPRAMSPAAAGATGAGAGRRRGVSSFLLRHSRSSPHLRDSVLTKERKKEGGGRKVSIQEPTSEGEREGYDDDGDIVFAPTMCFPPAGAGAASRGSAVPPKKTTTTSSSTKAKVTSPPHQTKPLPTAPAAATTRSSTTHLSPPPNLTSAFDDSLDSSPASRRVSASTKPESRTSWTGTGSRLLTTLTAADRRKANLKSDEPVVIAKKQAQQGEGEQRPTTMEGEAKGKEKDIEPAAVAATATTATAASPTSSSPTQTTRPALPRARGSGSGSLSRGSPVARPSEESRSASPPASNRPSTGGASTRKGSSSSAAVRRYAAGGGGSRPSSPPPPHPPPDEPLPALPFAAMGQPTETKRGTPSPTSSPRRRAKPLGLAISGAPTGTSTTVSPSQHRPSRDEPSSSPSSSTTQTQGGLLSRVARAALPTGIVPKSPSFRKPVPSMHIEGQEFVLARPGTSSSSGAASKERQQQQPPSMPASASSIGMRAYRGSPLPRPTPASASAAAPGAAPSSTSRDTAMTRSGASGSTGNATTTTAEWVLRADQDQDEHSSSSFDSFAAYRAFLGGPARPESVLEPTTPVSRQQRSTSDVGRGDVGRDTGQGARPGRMEVATQTGKGRDDAAAGGPVRPAGQSTPRRTASAGQPTTTTSLSPPASPYSPTAEMDISEPEVHRSTSPAAAAAAGLRRRGSSRSASAGGGGWHSAASSIMSGETTSAAPPFEMWNADSENVAGEDLFLQRLRSRRSQAEMRRREESGGEGAATAAGGEGTQGEASSSSPTGGSGGARRWWQQQQQNK